MRLTRAALAALPTCALALSANAHADTYTVHACQTPAGLAAPAAGWQGTRAGSAEATNGCAPSGLGVALVGAGPWDGGTGANQQFAAPADTRITRIRMRRATRGLAPSGGQALGYYLRADGRVLEGCAPGPGSSTKMPGWAFSSAWLAASTMPSETPNFILRGARLATITVSLPTRSSGW